jgi:Thioredoxin
MATPSGHTSDGGVLVGDPRADTALILFEDPQCPYCREFEEVNGALLAAAVDAGELGIEYRMRCFLGPESVRADNALALAAESGRFDELRRALFAAQPPEGTGGFTTEDLVGLGAQVGLTGPDYVAGVREGRYEQWVLSREARFETEDPQGTPAAWLNGSPLDSSVLFDSGEFARRIRGTAHR